MVVMVFFRYLCLILFGAISCWVSAAPINYYPLSQRISSEDGLSQNVVLSIELDGYQRLWVGTQDGLNLLHNNEFVVFKKGQRENIISGTAITDLIWDHEDRLWVASEAGLDVINTTTLEVRTIPLLNNSRGIHQLLLIGDNLFYLSEQKLYRYKVNADKAEALVLPSSLGFIFSVASFGEQHILVNSEHGLFKLNLTNGDVEKIEAQIPIGSYKAMLVDRDRIWISVKDKGLYACGLQGGDCHLYSKMNGVLPTNNIAKIHKQDDKLYLATDAGIGLLDLASDKLDWIYPHSEHNAYRASQIIRDISRTRSGDIFVGGFNGLYRIPKSFKSIQALNVGIDNYPETQLATNVIRIDDKEYLTIAEPDKLGLWSLNAKQLKPYKQYKYPRGYEPTSLQVDEEMIYLSSLTAGNLMLDPNSGQYQPLSSRFPQIDDTQLFHMETLEEDIRVFHVESMMKVYQRKQGYWQLAWQKPFIGNSAAANYFQGRLYVATYQGGLFSAAIEDLSKAPLNWQVHQGLGIVINLHSNSEELYVLTANLGVFQVQSSTPVRITKIPWSESLGNETSVCAVSDPDGNIFFSGHNGISISDSQSKNFEKLTVLQGAHGQEFTQYDCGILNGIPYLAGASGLTLVHSLKNISSEAPAVQWTHLEADGKKLYLENEHENHLTSPGVIKLHFVSTPSDLPKSTSFRYRIKSLSNSWIEVKSSSVSLINLRPGKYEIELVAQGFSGKVGNAAVTTIQVLPKVWESPLAIFIYIFIGLAVVVAFAVFKHKADRALLALAVTRNRQQQDYSRQLELEVSARTGELEQKKLEAEEANIAKTRFIAAASHDLKHPVNLIKLLLSQQQHSEIREHIGNNLNFLDQLISSIVELSRIDAKVIVPQNEPLNLSAFCSRVANEHKGLLEHFELSLELDVAEAVWINTDQLLLRRVIDNILNNAIKISDPGAVVELQLECREGQALLSITDQGPGMTAQMQSQIFTPFKRWTKRYQGSGLGLSVVEGISNLMGIKLSVISEFGQGCCFQLDFTTTKPPQKLDTSPSSLHIGIVEDDKEQLDWLSKALIAKGFTVTCYAHANTLLADSRAVFDVILSDIDIGTEQNGLDYLLEYRQQLRSPSLMIYMSGNPEFCHQLPEGNGLFFFAKPLKLGKLMWLLNQNQRG